MKIHRKSTPCGGYRTLLLHGMLSTIGFATWGTASSSNTPSMPTIPGVRHHDLVEARAQSDAASLLWLNTYKNCIKLAASPEEDAADRGREHFLSTILAADTKMSEYTGLMDKGLEDDWMQKWIAQWDTELAWRAKEAACNTLVQQENHDVVKYILSLINNGTANAGKLWTKLDMNRYNEGMMKCEDALGGRRRLMDRFECVLP